MDAGVAVALAVVVLALVLLCRPASGSGNRRSSRPVKVDKALTLPRATATKRSGYLAKKFGVKPQSRITVSLDRVVVGGEIINSKRTVWTLVKNLLPLGDVFLCAKADSDEEQERIVKALEEREVIKPGSAMPPHRLLFYSNEIGKDAIIRQLNPHLHIDGELTTLQNIARFLPKVVHIGQAKPAEAYAANHSDWTTISSVEEIVHELQQLDS